MSTCPDEFLVSGFWFLVSGLWFLDSHTFLLRLTVPATAAKFIAYSMLPSFVTDLAEDIETINGKKAQQTDDRTGDAGETALTRSHIKQARDLIADLDASVRNRFRTDPEILAQ